MPPVKFRDNTKRRVYEDGAGGHAEAGVDEDSTGVERANLEVTLLASAARTANTNSADQTMPHGRGVRISIDVTAIVTAPSITVAIQVKDPISGVYTAVLTSAAIAATGHTEMVVYPGITAAANVAAAMVMSRTWRVSVTHANGNSITYSIAANILL